jgi:hypothetical protein
LLCSKDVGKQDSLADPLRAATNVVATNVAAIRLVTTDFTKITITTLLLTRILDRLIGGGISLYSGGV